MKQNPFLKFESLFSKTILSNFKILRYNNIKNCKIQPIHWILLRINSIKKMFTLRDKIIT